MGDKNKKKNPKGDKDLRDNLGKSYVHKGERPKGKSPVNKSKFSDKSGKSSDSSKS